MNRKDRCIKNISHSHSFCVTRRLSLGRPARTEEAGQDAGSPKTLKERSAAMRCDAGTVSSAMAYLEGLRSIALIGIHASCGRVLQWGSCPIAGSLETAHRVLAPSNSKRCGPGQSVRVCLLLGSVAGVGRTRCTGGSKSLRRADPASCCSMSRGSAVMIKHGKGHNQPVRADGGAAVWIAPPVRFL